MSKLIPAPCIIPLCLPKFGKSKCIDVSTMIDLCCDKEGQDLEIFYTIDGTKPQPYIDIVQGSKTHKFVAPFSLPPGKVTVKAITAHAVMPGMFSSVVTKTFHVEQSPDIVKKPKQKKYHIRNCIVEKPDMPKHEEETKNPVLNSPANIMDSSSENVAESCVVATEDELPATDVFPVEPLDQNAVLPEQHETVESSPTDSPDCAEGLNDSSSETIEDISECSFTKEDAKDVQVPLNQSPAANETPNVENSDALVKYGIPLQHCYVCSKVNSLTSRYCDKCGTKLYLVCNNCEECNPTFALFCQYCGVKLSKDEKEEEPDISCKEPVQLEDVGVWVRPPTAEKFTQILHDVTDKFVQTVPVRKKEKVSTKHLPMYTPGRGYWRQQVDYICNYLKAHAHNNLDFRKQLGEPSLGHFLSADVIKSEEEVLVQLKFEMFHLEQLSFNGGEPSKADRP